VELCGEEGDKKVKDPSNLNKILNHQSPPNQLEQKTTYKDIESFKEKIKLIPSLSNVLIEYEKLYSNKKAYEMFEILIDDIAKKFNELLKSIPEENIKIKKNEYEE
jgi:Mg2+ and Co2+ transporter CorA